MAENNRQLNKGEQFFFEIFSKVLTIMSQVNFYDYCDIRAVHRKMYIYLFAAIISLV